MKTCKCGRPASAGHSGSDASTTICMLCWTEKVMRDFVYPASAEGQRKLRVKKAQSR